MSAVRAGLVCAQPWIDGGAAAEEIERFSIIMNTLLKRLPVLTLLAIALAGCNGASSSTAAVADTGKGNLPAKTDKSITPVPNSAGKSNGLDSLCDNHYNKLGLPAGEFEKIKDIIDSDKKVTVEELKTRLNAKEITASEASWGLYYLGQKSLKDQDFKSFIKYLTVSADDYLNPWAMTLLAKVYYYDKSEWQKQFPKAEISTDKNLEKSYMYLTLAFLISGDIEKDHQDNSILTGVANGGLALKDTFEGRGVSGFDTKAAIEKNKQEMLDRAAAYKKMYATGK